MINLFLFALASCRSVSKVCGSNGLCKSSHFGLFYSCIQGPAPGQTQQLSLCSPIDAQSTLGNQAPLAILLGRAFGAVAIAAAVIPVFCHIALACAKLKGRHSALRTQKKWKLRLFCWSATAAALAAAVATCVAMTTLLPHSDEPGPCFFLMIVAWLGMLINAILIDRRMVAAKLREAMDFGTFGETGYVLVVLQTCVGHTGPTLTRYCCIAWKPFEISSVQYVYFSLLQALSLGTCPQRL